MAMVRTQKWGVRKGPMINDSCEYDKTIAYKAPEVLEEIDKDIESGKIRTFGEYYDALGISRSKCPNPNKKILKTMI